MTAGTTTLWMDKKLKHSIAITQRMERALSRLTSPHSTRCPIYSLNLFGAFREPLRTSRNLSGTLRKSFKNLSGIFREPFENISEPLQSKNHAFRNSYNSHGVDFNPHQKKE